MNTTEPTPMIEKPITGAQLDAAHEKGLTLRALVENELQIMQALYDAGGEITPEIEGRLKLSENAMPEKVDGYAHMIDRLTSEAQRLEVIEDQYRQMIGSLHKAIDWMKETLKTAMLQMSVEEITGVDRKFRLQRATPRLEVDKDYLPAIYMREEVIYKNNTDQIKKDLADGVKVPGARLVESYYVKAYANSPTKLAEPKKSKRSKKNEVQQ